MSFFISRVSGTYARYTTDAADQSTGVAINAWVQDTWTHLGWTLARGPGGMYVCICVWAGLWHVGLLVCICVWAGLWHVGLVVCMYVYMYICIYTYVLDFGTWAYWCVHVHVHVCTYVMICVKCAFVV